MGQIEINHTGSGGGVVLSSDGTDLLLGGSAIGGGGASALTLADKTGNYTVVAGDLGKILTFSGSGTGTFTLTAAATLGSGWFCYIVDNGTATANQLTIDPNGSETINLKTTYVFAAGGGIKLICDGSNFFTEQPSFDNSIAINKPAAFSKAVATGYGAIAISTGQSNGNGAYGQNSVVINAGVGSAGSDAVAIGSGPTYATGSKSLGMVGGIATGMEALALGRGYASGENSTAINISSSSSSYGATSLHSIAFGYLSKATGEHSIVLGKQNIASNHWAFVGGGAENTGSGAYSATFGTGNTNSGTANFCAGYGSTADGDYGAAIGRTVSQRDQNHTLAFGLAGQPWTSGSTPDGASQTRITGYAKQTADATPIPMNGYTTNHAVNAENSFTLPNNAAATFSLTVIANVTGGGNSKAWKLEGAVKRGASASATALIGSVIKTTVAEDSGAANWDVSIAANTTIGGLVITCTGQASTSIRWVGRMDSTEVTY